MAQQTRLSGRIALVWDLGGSGIGFSEGPRACAPIHDINSHLNRRLREACQTYNNGLTIGEQVLALARGLNIVQLEVLTDLALLETDAEAP
jgi:hypothetical protein